MNPKMLTITGISWSEDKIQIFGYHGEKTFQFTFDKKEEENPKLLIDSSQLQLFLSLKNLLYDVTRIVTLEELENELNYKLEIIEED